MKSQADNNDILSKAIDLLRIPSAIAVIFIHLSPQTHALTQLNIGSFSMAECCNIVYVSLSHVLARIAVPIFFLISGLLFFINMKSWSWETYRKKIGNRLKTLVLPYIVWNLFAFTIIIIRKIFEVQAQHGSWANLTDYLKSSIWHIFIDYHIWGQDQINLLGYANYSTAPIIIPLWFLRDLIVMSFLAPVIFWIVKDKRYLGLLLLVVAYLSSIWITLPGFGINAALYFTIGAFISVNNINFVATLKRISGYTIPLSIVLFILCVVYDGPFTSTGNLIMPFYTLSTVLVAFFFATYLAETKGINVKSMWVKSCFFIYAAHTAPLFIKWSPLQIVSKTMYHISSNIIIFDFICFLIIPFVTFSFCLGIYWAITNYTPNLAKFFTGIR